MINNKSILISGASGFIGNYFFKKIYYTNYKIFYLYYKSKIRKKKMLIILK